MDKKVTNNDKVSFINYKLFMQRVFDELKCVITHNTDEIYSSLYTYRKSQNTKICFPHIINSEIYTLFGESNEFSRLYYSEPINYWKGNYKMETEDIPLYDYSYGVHQDCYFKLVNVYDLKFDKQTAEFVVTIDEKKSFIERLTANINARNIIKTHTYFINACTNTCTCKGFFYQKKCKHLKLINKFKADLFTNLVLLLKNYTNITMAIDIARDYV